MPKSQYRPSLRRIVGENIAIRRKSMRLSQEKLGEQASHYLDPERPWQKQTVSAIERGRRPVTVEELIAIAIPLRISIESLLMLTWEADPLPDDSQVEMPSGVSIPVETLRGVISGVRQVLGKALFHIMEQAETGGGLDRIQSIEIEVEPTGEVHTIKKSAGRGKAG